MSGREGQFSDLWGCGEDFCTISPNFVSKFFIFPTQTPAKFFGYWTPLRSQLKFWCLTGSVSTWSDGMGQLWRNSGLCSFFGNFIVYGVKRWVNLQCELTWFRTVRCFWTVLWINIWPIFWGWQLYDHLRSGCRCISLRVGITVEADWVILGVLGSWTRWQLGRRVVFCCGRCWRVGSDGSRRNLWVWICNKGIA